MSDILQFAEADARYDIGRPPFVWQSWAVDEFEVGEYLGW